MHDVQLVHSLAGGYIGWAAQEVAREMGVPFVCTPFVHPHQWGDGPHDVAYYKRADAVVGLVETDRQYLQSLGVAADHLHVIGVSPDLAAVSDGEEFRRRHNLGNAPVVLYIGRMMEQKGAPFLLQAASEVWRQTPETRFIFIGPGDAASDAWFAGADQRIQYLGKVEAQEKADALAACDIFCMPSESEILPTVYLEAWSLAKPVVAGRAPGLPELVEGNKAGICVPQNAAEIAPALLQLLSDLALRTRLGSNGKHLVEAKYSVTAVTDSLETLYTSLVAQRAKHSLQSTGTRQEAAVPSTSTPSLI